MNASAVARWQPLQSAVLWMTFESVFAPEKTVNGPAGLVAQEAGELPAADDAVEHRVHAGSPNLRPRPKGSSQTQ